MLPKGQFDIGRMPRFGLLAYKNRFPSRLDSMELKIGGKVENPYTIGSQLGTLIRREQTSDFHCVTTWSATNLNWQGIPFRDFYEQLVVPVARPDKGVKFVNIKCQDGYHSCLLLEDMLRENVMIADQLNGSPLSIANGAPVRLVAPDHYGYKNAKHISEINFHREEIRPKSALNRFLVHPRGRVDLEERGVGLPGWLLRYLYRPLISSTSRQFQNALERHLAK